MVSKQPQEVWGASKNVYSNILLYSPPERFAAISKPLLVRHVFSERKSLAMMRGEQAAREYIKSLRKAYKVTVVESRL